MWSEFQIEFWNWIFLAWQQTHCTVVNRDSKPSERGQGLSLRVLVVRAGQCYEGGNCTLVHAVTGRRVECEMFEEKRERRKEGRKEGLKEGRMEGEQMTLQLLRVDLHLETVIRVGSDVCKGKGSISATVSVLGLEQRDQGVNSVQLADLVVISGVFRGSGGEWIVNGDGLKSVSDVLKQRT